MMGSGMAMATPPRSLFKLRHTSSVTASHTSPSRSLPSLESTQLAPTDLRQRFSMGITNSSSSIHSTRLSSACRKHIASSRLHPLPKGTFSVSSKARRSRAKPLYYDPRTTLCGKDSRPPPPMKPNYFRAISLSGTSPSSASLASSTRPE